MSISLNVVSNATLKFVFGYCEQKQLFIDKLNQLTNEKFSNIDDAIIYHGFILCDWKLKPTFDKLQSIDEMDEFYKTIAPFVLDGKIVYITEDNEVIVYNFINYNLFVTTYIKKD